jgi:tRNA(Ile2) C34 agmatinyltransferase TiaS
MVCHGCEIEMTSETKNSWRCPNCQWFMGIDWAQDRSEFTVKHIFTPNKPVIPVQV